MAHNIQYSYQVSLEKAAWFIYAFLRQPRLYKIATEEAIGGTVYKDSLKNPAGVLYLGSMGWYCRNVNRDGSPKNPSFPKLFMAFEDAQYDTDNVPQEPVGDPLFYASDTFKFNRDLNEANVLDMLAYDQHRLIPYPDKTIDKKDLVTLLNYLPNDPLGKPYNGFPCSFFENRGNEDMEKLMEDPEVVAVRYYFGYDDCDWPHYLSNRIRIILIGVDSQGRNIPPTVSTSLPSTSMLQNSWPPPPPY